MQEDMLLRAVRFLDTMIQRDNLQKAAFLKDLGSIWPHDPAPAGRGAHRGAAARAAAPAAGHGGEAG